MRRFEDQLGRRLSVAGRPARIVSIVPSLTELVFDLGAGARLVGRTRFCVHPAGPDGAAAVPGIGGTKGVDLARVEACRPDLVIANREENERSDVEALAGLAPVFVTDIAGPSAALDAVRRIADVVGCGPAGEALAGRLERAYAALPDLGGRRVAYLIWRKPWMAVGGGTYIDAMLSGCRLVNAFGERTRYPELTLDELRAARLDALLLSSEPFPFRRRHADELAEALPGVSIVPVDGEVFSWYGTRLLHASGSLEDLRQRLA